MRNDFYEPDKGGMIGWASRQLVLWLVGGFFIYALVAKSGLLTPQDAAVTPGSAQASSAVTLVRPNSGNSLTLRAGPDGHVYTEAAVNGAPIRMIVDTGATDVVLTMADAAKAGFSAGQLSFSGRSKTANGVTRVAPVTLRDVRIGQLEIGDVRASVVEHLDISLLGQTFLRRLESYEMRDGVLTLNWR